MKSEQHVGNTEMNDESVVFSFSDFCGHKGIDPRVTLNHAMRSDLLKFCMISDLTPEETLALLSTYDWADAPKSDPVGEEQLAEINRRLSEIVGDATNEQLTEILRAVMRSTTLVEIAAK